MGRVNRTRPIKIVEHLSYKVVFVFGYNFNSYKKDKIADAYFDEFIEMMRRVFNFEESTNESM